MYAAPKVTGPPCQQTVKIGVYNYGVLLVEVLTKILPSGNILSYLRSLEAQWPQYVAIGRKCANVNATERPTMVKVLNDLQEII